MSDRNNPLRQFLDAVATSARAFTRPEVAAEIRFNPDVSPDERRECLDAVVDATIRMAAATADGERAHARRVAADCAETWTDLIAYPERPSKEIADNDNRGLAAVIMRDGVA